MLFQEPLIGIDDEPACVVIGWWFPVSVDRQYMQKTHCITALIPVNP